MSSPSRGDLVDLTGPGLLVAERDRPILSAVVPVRALRFGPWRWNAACREMPSSRPISDQLALAGSIMATTITCQPTRKNATWAISRGRRPAGAWPAPYPRQAGLREQGRVDGIVGPTKEGR